MSVLSIFHYLTRYITFVILCRVVHVARKGKLCSVCKIVVH